MIRMADAATPNFGDGGFFVRVTIVQEKSHNCQVVDRTRL